MPRKRSVKIRCPICKKAVKPSTVFTMPKVGATYTVTNPAEVLAKETVTLTIWHRAEKEEDHDLMKVMIHKEIVVVLDQDTVVRVVLIVPDTLSPKIKHLFVEVQSGEYEGRKGWISPCGVLPMKEWIGCIQNEADNWK